MTTHSSAVGVRIAGTGMAVPRNAVTNRQLEQRVDTNDEWIVKRTGIRQRYLCEDDERCSDLAIASMRQALERAGMQADELDLVIAATLSPDMVIPTISCQTAAALGATPCGAIDVNLACTGYVAAITMAANFIRTGMYQRIGIVGVEKMSGLLDWNDRGTCVLFGDGAGAAIITASDNPEQGCVYQKLHSDGSKACELYLPRCAADVVDPTRFNGKYDTIQMNGREVFKVAVTVLSDCVSQAMSACGLTVDDVAMLVPHQSNSRIIDAARQRLGFDPDRVYVNIDRYGNTSGASIGICLHELMEQKWLKEGDIVIFAAVGAGMTWGVSVWRL